MKLEDFSRALREEADTPGDRSDDTRARVLARLERVRRRRAKRVFVVLPIAAVLAGATASAAALGRLPSAWHSVAQVLHWPSRSASTTEPRAVESPPPTETRDDPPHAESTANETSSPPPDPAVNVPHASKLRPIAAPQAAPVTSADHGTEPPAEMSAPDSLALYRAAHRLHFSERDPAAALVAWDAYLAADPAGAFALEARYNRALCLVRLGRTAEAREALLPFARGVSGGYRKSEARALLAVLDRESGEH
jgi:hypothetical protein